MPICCSQAIAADLPLFLKGDAAASCHRQFRSHFARAPQQIEPGMGCDWAVDRDGWF